MKDIIRLLLLGAECENRTNKSPVFKTTELQEIARDETHTPKDSKARLS